MRLSIIIPTYNESGNLAELLNLLIGNSDELAEITVVDSPDSTDDSESICAQYEQVRYVKSDNAGRASQMNLGVEYSRGDVIWFVHADVRPPREYISLIQEQIENGDGYGFFSYRFEPDTWLLRWNSRYTKSDGIFAGAGDQCQYFTRAAWEEMNGYDETFCIMEDFDMTRRIRRAEIPYSIIPQDVVVSSRKYQENSWLRVNLINLWVFIHYRLGSKPSKLKRLYSSLLRC